MPQYGRRRERVREVRWMGRSAESIVPSDIGREPEARTIGEEGEGDVEHPEEGRRR